MFVTIAWQRYIVRAYAGNYSPTEACFSKHLFYLERTKQHRNTEYTNLAARKLLLKSAKI